jgi:hypothetical protein
MQPHIFRIFLVLWLVCDGALVWWSLFGGWAGWPVPAQVYAQWALYQTEVPPLPSQFQIVLFSQVLLVLGGVGLALLISRARYLFLSGLFLHMYGSYSTIPVIASGSEVMISSIFYALSGVVVTASFVGSGALFGEKQANNGFQGTSAPTRRRP